MNDFKIGLTSGIISAIICNPLDVIRVHYQTNTKIDKLNFKFLYRGIKNSFFTIPLFWSIYFPLYNYLKNDKPKYISGYISCNVASTITCPLWFIKQKNQLNESFNISQFYKKNGIKPFYNSLFTTYLVNTSFIFQMPIYENLKNKCNNNTYNIFIITSLSKTIATCITYPIDTIRTLQRENIHTSLFEIINKLLKNPSNFYNGIHIYLIKSIPYHTSIFCCYEFLQKFYCSKKK